MSDFGETFHPLARKQHRCEWCYGPIPKGERHAQYRGIYDGDWQNWRMHQECYDAYVSDYPEDGFDPGGGECPDRIKQLRASPVAGTGEKENL